eukprot:TCONS_00064141-protein
MAATEALKDGATEKSYQQDKADEFLASLVSDITQNIDEPSTPFFMNLGKVYDLPRDSVIKSLQQLKNPTSVTLFREQMFYLFLAHYTENEKVLSDNGFNCTKDNAKTHLKTRRSTVNALEDIYELGKSIHENRIASGLASKILKDKVANNPKTVEPDIQPIPEDATILQKLQAIIAFNAKLVTQNKELKLQMSELEKDNTFLREHLISVEAKLDTLISSNTLKQQHTIAEDPIVPIAQQQPPGEQHDNDKRHDDQPAQNARSDNKSHHKQTNENHKKQLQNKNVVYGGKSHIGKNVSGVTRPYSLFVGGFDLRLSPEETKNIITNDMDIKVLDIHLNRKNGYNQSFRVNIDILDKSKAFEPDRWYKGLVVKPFRQPREPKANQPSYETPNRYNVLDDQHPNRYHNQHQYRQNNRTHRDSSYDQDYNRNDFNDRNDWGWK